MGEATSYPKTAPIGTILVVLGAMVIFVAMTFILRATRPENESYDAKRAQARAEIRDTTLAKSRELVASTAWVDKEKGIARIPVSDAMGLAVSQLSSKPVAVSTVPVPTPIPAAAPSPSPAAGESQQGGSTGTDGSSSGPTETGFGAAPTPAPEPQPQAPDATPVGDAAITTGTSSATTMPPAN